MIGGQVNVDDCGNAEKNKPQQDGVLPDWKEAAEKGRRLTKIETLEKQWPQRSMTTLMLTEYY